MAEGGFRLRKWTSNLASSIKEITKLEVLNSQSPASPQTCDFPDFTREDDESYAKSATNLSSPSSCDGNTVKVLGVNWDTANNEIFFNFAELYKYGKSLPVNKRSVLELTAKIFNP